MLGCAHLNKPSAMNATPVLLDPVCGMTVTEASPYRFQNQGETVYFCSAHCKDKFTSKTSGSASHITVSGSRTSRLYTCPMHPEIRQDHAGSCPKCGMALEPEEPTADEEENPELVDFRHRFWWTLPLSVSVMMLAMFGHYLPWLTSTTSSWIEMALSTPVVLWAGWPFFVRAWQSVRTLNPNMWTLIGTGTSAAYLYSVIATAAPQLFPAEFVSMGRVSVYFEASAVIISLTLLGQVLELKARSQTSSAIRSLLDLSPKMARLIQDDGTEEDIPLSDVHVGDLLRVRPGEKIPVDGIVIEGQSAVVTN
jgi:P-type Cu+ transporter